MGVNFLWVLLSFLLGALPLSVWLGRLALGVDIREFGDGNPGAANVWRAGGAGWGWLAILLDFFKGAIPVGLANFVFNVDGWWLTAVALAPILGHAFSPFLRFHGGKALAVTFGIWSGLSLWTVPITLGLLFAIWLYWLKPEGWSVMVGSFCLLIVLLFLPASSIWLAVWLGMALIFAWTHRTDLAQRPRLRQFRQ